MKSPGTECRAIDWCGSLLAGGLRDRFAVRKPFGASVAVDDLVDRFLDSGGLLAGAVIAVAVPVAHSTFAVHGQAETETRNAAGPFTGGDGRFANGLPTSFFLAAGQGHKQAKSEELFHFGVLRKGRLLI